MIEIIIFDYLNKHLTVPTFTEHQDAEPERFVLIDKTGGGKNNHLVNSTIVIQSYAESKYQASLLNEQVKSIMEKIDELAEISGIELNSDYDFTDQQTKRHRYQAVFDIYHY
ncbi:hypothetical protein [Streptococcus uberis]|uniref:hypothetical protein n=1 Tax=Streptococcus uberis TaxID=1349 RepID=UPI001939AF54|nr:hypothetical protein [Streptococcus uberis]MCK1227506.1 hypothetical protein [Streptococcus uberis]